MSKNPQGFAFFNPTSRVVPPEFPACHPCSSNSTSLSPKDQRPWLPALEAYSHSASEGKRQRPTNPRYMLSFFPLIQPVKEEGNIVHVDVFHRAKTSTPTFLKFGRIFTHHVVPKRLVTLRSPRKKGWMISTMQAGCSLGLPFPVVSPIWNVPGSTKRYEEPLCIGKMGVVGDDVMVMHSFSSMRPGRRQPSSLSRSCRDSSTRFPSSSKASLTWPIANCSGTGQHATNATQYACD